MNRVVLDASAVITLLEGRRGADTVEKALGQSFSNQAALFISAVNWGEVFCHVWVELGYRAAAHFEADFAQYPIEITRADREVTRAAAALQAQFRLPYLDCFAAALAIDKNARLFTSDKDFRKVAHAIPVQFLK